MSYSYSVFSHNPSCSLTHNSTDIYAAGEGTNGSVHSRFNFRPMGDGSVAFATAPLKEGTSSFPTELPARLVASAAALSASGSFDGSRGGMHSSRPAGDRDHVRFGGYHGAGAAGFPERNARGAAGDGAEHY